MNVWLVKMEELLPMDKDYRAYRMGMLAEALVNSGHKVTRWCSDLNPQTKKYRHGHDYTLVSDHGVTYELLYVKGGDNQSVSLKRYLNNFLIAIKFKKKALNLPPPDLIVCAMPTPQLSRISSEIAKFFKTPLVVDARDYWPDIIEQELKGIKKYVSMPLIYLMKNDLRKACIAAYSLVGITPFYRDHLVNYSGRVKTDKDSFFPLGYDGKLNQVSYDKVDEYNNFWIKKLKLDLLNTEKKIIYFAGKINLTVKNGVQPLISSLEKSGATNSNYIFILCGAGQYLEELQNLLRDVNNVYLPGHISAEHLAYLRSKSFVAIQPIENRIDYENSLSNKFFENISAGLPILTSLTGITRKEIESNRCGFYYSSGSELLRLLNKLDSNIELYEEMSKNALELFDTTYDSKVVYRNFSTYLERIAQEF